NCAVKFVPPAVGLKLTLIKQELGNEPVAANTCPVQLSLPLGIEKYDALVPVIALKPVIFAAELAPFATVINTAPGKLVEAETFAGFGVATSALLPVPFPGIENGLPDAPV